jgi:septal ring factor EnvC (AmiA/AmiB activator)
LIDYQNTPTPPAKKSGGSPVMMGISGFLTVAVIVVGILYGVQAGKLSTANKNITDLQLNVSSLTTQLNTEKTMVSDLTANLATETAKSADLQKQLDSTKADLATANTNLTAANAKVTDLTAQLATSTAKVTSLTTDLSTANAKVTSTQTSLDKANADLAVANATIATQTANLKKVQDARHFSTVNELQAWLASDDTNTNPAYASLSSAARAYVLETKALRDGYLLPVSLTWDTQYIYSLNMAIVVGTIYSVNAATDAILAGPTFSIAPPLHPLPMP